TGDYSGVNPLLKELMDRLAPERVAVSLRPTRVAALSPRLLEQIRRVRKTGFTLAPEAGTQRLRDVIQKEYREEELLDAARLFAELGWGRRQLHVLIGARSRRAGLHAFPPTPHTPFQWAAQLDVEQTQARQALLRRELGRRGVEFRWHDSQLSWLEGGFRRGGRRLADVIETAQRAGARFDGWSDHCRIDVWREALAAKGLRARADPRPRALREAGAW